MPADHVIPSQHRRHFAAIMRQFPAVAGRMRAILLLAGLLSFHAAAPAQTSGASMQQTSQTSPVTAALTAAFAPDGTLRASINLGNPVLAYADPQSGAPAGVSVDLATELARRLGLPLQLVAVRSAGASVENIEQGKADIGFFAIDPKRAQEISFTGPYVLIEGFYAVHADSPVTANEQVDRPGVTVAVGKGSAYDLFLTRELKHATIVRIPTSPAVVQGFLDKHLDVAAGVRQQLEHDAARTGGLRILDQRFMVIRQAMGVPKARGEAAADYLSAFVEEMKASGFVAASLARHHIEGALVAKRGD